MMDKRLSSVFISIILSGSLIGCSDIEDQALDTYKCVAAADFFKDKKNE